MATARELALEALRRHRRNALVRYRPYPKQYEFHAAGKLARERALFAGNQLGKTHGGAHELAMHLSGKYPDWWPGHRFSRPVLCWTGAKNTEASREILQRALLGTEETSLKHQDMGTGTIPGADIVKITTRQAGVRDVVDQIVVKHITGGESRVVMKTYDQQRDAWQGKKVDVLWLDEPPPDDVYSEALTRTQAVPDGLLMATFTPMLGTTAVVKRYTQGLGEGAVPPIKVGMTIYDCIGGVWPEGTPWAGQKWTGHYTKERADQIVSAYPDHERDARAYGVPMAGEGLVWPIAESAIKCDPFPIPKHFARLCGLDFGMDHPFAAVWLAWDRDTDTVYLYHCFRRRGETPVYHVAQINAQGKWIPAAWPHDGENRDKGSGEKLIKQYIAHGLNALSRNARYDEEKGGAQSVEPIVLEIFERMRTGRFKVFSTCGDWLEEFRSYHREDGKIVDKDDDLMAATRIAMIDLRMARVENVIPIKPRSQYSGSLLRQVG